MPRREPDLRKLARLQRGMLWVILAGIVVYLFQMLVLESAFGIGGDFELILFAFLSLVQIALTLSVSAFVALVLHAMGVHIVWVVLWTLLSLAPCANLLLLVVLNGRVTHLLRRAGLHVRFMGVDPEELERILNPHLCKTCGYDLTGNVSGVCPECGTLVPPPLARPLDELGGVVDFNALADRSTRAAK